MGTSGNKCSLCGRSSSEQAAIKAAMVAGVSNRAIAEQHHSNKDTVRNHRAHVFKEVAEDPQTLEVSMPPEVPEVHKYNFVQELMTLKTRAFSILTEAETEKNHTTAVTIMREIRNMIETIIKVALAQRELEQKEIDPGADVKEISAEILAIVDRGLEYDEETVEVEYEVVDDTEASPE